MGTHPEGMTSPVSGRGPTRRRSRVDHVVVGVVGGIAVLHGAVHLLGAAKGFGRADVPQLTEPISAAVGAVWLLAAVATMAAGVLLLASVRWWWSVGAAAVLLSQVLIVLHWRDAAFGTPANVVLAAAVIYGFAAHGPRSLEREYHRRAGDALRLSSTTRSAARASGHARPLLTEADLVPLPAPVARYIRQSGAVGRPRVDALRALIHGRIRSGADKPWMDFTGEQVNTYGPCPERFFTMDATMAHLPVDVLHVFTGDSATMRVRLCALLPMVDASGPELTRAETVTLLNDLCVLAPAALPDARITWTPVDDFRVRATFTRGTCTVTGELLFDEHDQLVDFTSDDRYAGSPDGKTFRQQRWSTPLHDYRSFHGRTISARGRARWHAPEPGGTFTYLEFELDDITYPADTHHDEATQLLARSTGPGR